MTNLYLKEFEDDCKAQGFEKHTIESYLSNIRLFFEYVDVPADKVEIFHLTDFLNYLRFEKTIPIQNKIKVGAAKSTINAYFSALNAYYDFLEFSGQLDHNPIPKFRKRYLKRIKRDMGPDSTRQLISIRQMAELVYTTGDLLERAIIITLAKSGIRRKELIAIDLEDLDLVNGIIYLKPTAKRTNRIIFIDQEAIEVLESYLEIRFDYIDLALFISNSQRGGQRISRNFVYNTVTQNAQRLGFHNPDGLLIEKFTPHCCRHWFTTHLRRAGMSREFRQALRGDVVKDAVDIYDHIDLEELRKDYLDKIPQLKPALLCPDVDQDSKQAGRQTILQSF
jgi:integrase/recombinase XerD